jgi:[ribosomal protein S5]-alanine N-acetyltransferase
VKRPSLPTVTLMVPPSLFPVMVEGDRVRLREFTSDDLERIWEWGSSPEFFRYVAIRPPASFDDERAWLAAVVEGAARRPRGDYELGIEAVDGSLLVGSLRLAIEPDRRLRSASIGYGIHPALWGRGYATEAARLIIEFGFQSLGHHRIWATYHPDNVASARVLDKAGMQLEGRLRHHRITQGALERLDDRVGSRRRLARLVGLSSPSTSMIRCQLSTGKWRAPLSFSDAVAARMTRNVSTPVGVSTTSHNLLRTRTPITCSGGHSQAVSARKRSSGFGLKRKREPFMTNRPPASRHRYRRAARMESAVE